MSSFSIGETLNGEHLDAVLCVAGGWAGGNASSENMIKNSEILWKQNVWTSTISARIAALYLKKGGLLQFTGAASVRFSFIHIRKKEIPSVHVQYCLVMSKVI